MYVIQGPLRSAAGKGSPGPSVPGPWVAALCAALLSIAACRQAPSAAQAPAQGAKDSAAAEAPGVTLKPDAIDRMGIRITPVVATQQAPESTGFAFVLTREAIAQSIADLNTAAAVERQSRAALARARSLAGTPGAPSVAAQEAAERPSIRRRWCWLSGACQRPMVETRRGRATPVVLSWPRSRAARSSSHA